MSDLNIALILKFVDQATAPARAAMQNIQGAAERVERFGAAQMAQGTAMREVAQQNTAALRGSALATAGVGFALYTAMRPAIEFEAQMDSVAAKSKATVEEQAALEAQALALGAETRYSALEAAQGMEALAVAGLNTNQTMTAMPGMLDLAAASGVALGTTADYATNILSGFQLQVDQMSRLGDVMVNTFTSSNTTLDDLALTMSYAAPFAANLNVDLETTAAMAGVLGNNALKGEKGGTALRAILSRLAAPSTEARRALEDLGVSITDADGNMRALPEILSEMNAAMDGMGNAARSEINTVIFGMEAAGAANILMGEASSGALQAYIESLRETGSASRVAAEMSDNARGALARLRSVVEGAQIALGNGLLPVLVDLAERAMPFIAATGDWISANQELVTTIGWWVASLLALNIGVLAAQLAFWLLFGWVGKLRVALGALFVAFGWLGRALAIAGRALLTNPIFLAIAAVAAAVYVIYDNWDGITAYFTGKFDRVKAAFEDGFLAGLIALWQEFNIFTLIRD
ncbi:phage tail tape measure protein, partial [Roseinatronobacter ekhonensis]|uniref:phage tail tape measure protein n=1 Tax=Roseinatronobacter ekhonensis TaxID=254356 RepID=UPI000EAF3E79